MKKHSFQYIIMLFSILLTTAIHSSCSDSPDIAEEESIENNEDGNENNGNSSDIEESISQIITEWGESAGYVIANMQNYDMSVSEEDFLLFNGKGTDRSVSYQFHEGGLCAAAILIPTTDVQTDIQLAPEGYIYLGNQESTAVYMNQDKNTFITAYREDAYQVIGFTPIVSSAFENLPPIIVTTNAAESIGYTSAKVSGTVTGIEEATNAKIYVYYDMLPTFPAETNKTAELGSNLSVTLSGLEMGTTYYYCATVCIDNIYYYGNTNSFTTLKEKTYAIGDFYPNATSPEGVVFYIEDGGKHGKIVSLDNEKRMKWDTNSIGCQYYGNTNSVDGSRNTMSTSSSLVGGWCYNHGDGWYCPAKGELIKLNKAIKEVNAALSSKGYDTIDGFFWSSTEYANNEAYIVCVSAYGYMGYTGGWSGNNTKNQNNSVCAIKKF